ncbi:MAG TPA: hypothetical protein ENO22_07235 [candidate division Zixibacteria bacterium]|nr:hypothetical protein [candidate division Zixibacteria bacterium]HEQ99117.1 hypothetical protein [candidate division Zixibacteria bacterium]
MPQKAKRVLIVSYYFPPMGLGGVQRAAKTAKYLAQEGWHVHVLACNPDNYPIRDESLLNDLPEEVEITYLDDPVARHSRPSAEHDYILRGRSHLLRRIVQIPDSKKFWADRATKTAEKIIHDHSIAYLLTTSPPPSTHTVGIDLKRDFCVSWLADFRDPWFADSEKPITVLHTALQQNLEKNIIQYADRIVGVTSAHVRDLQKRYARFKDKIHHIPNGFDGDDFKNVEESFPEKLILAHGGTLCSPHTAGAFFEALLRLESEMLNQTEFWQIGAVDQEIHDMLLTRFADKIKIEFTGYMNHRDTLRQLAKSSAIVVFGGVDKKSLNIIPAKLYEGLAFKKPLLAVVEKTSAVHEVISRLQGVHHLDPDDSEGMKNLLKKIVDDHKAGTLFNQSRLSQLRKYERKYQARQMAELMENI